MSEAVVNGQFIGHVSEVQIALVQEAEPKGVCLPPREVSLPFQSTAITPDIVDALMFGLEEQVQAPREATFKGHGVTGTLRNLAFHDDGQELVGTDGCVRMSMTMTGDLEDMHFESAAKNRAWRRLKRRRMLRDCRERARRRERAHRQLRSADKDIARSMAWLERESVKIARLLGISRAVLEEVYARQERLIRGSKLIYHNQWNDWDDYGQVIHNSLEPWPADREPQPGDDFWMDTDPLYHHGKVYGYVLYRVDFVENGGVHHSGGFCSREWFFRNARLVKDSEYQALWAFLDANPRACNL